MKINWKVRFKNPLFIWQLLLAILIPILAYMGLTVQDITSWGKVGSVLWEAVKNPYVLGLVIVSVHNSVIDPTVGGYNDSKQALTYNVPRKDAKE